METLARRDRRRRTAAAVTFAAGLLALLSASLPPLRGRLETLLGLTPYLVPQTAAGVTALAGCALLVVARGLRRGSRLAWVSALVLLVLLAGLHLVKGIDVEESAVTAAVAVYLSTQRRAFPVLPSRAVAVRAVVLGVGGALAAVFLVAAITVGFGGHRHHPAFGESAEQAADRLVGVDEAARVGVPAGVVPGLGPASSRVLPVVGVGLVCSVLWLVFAPRRAPRLPRRDHDVERERARAVVARWGGDTLAFFALRDDKDWFFTGSSVVAHSVRGDVCLVSPDPVGPPQEREAVWADFRDYAERNGWTVLVIGAGQAWLPVYEATGMRGVYLGDEAVLDCTTFTLAGGAMKSLRQGYNRVGRAGITFSFRSPASLAPQERAELLAMSAQSRRGDAERGFSMTLSRLANPCDTELLLTVARQRVDGDGGDGDGGDGAGRVVGFVQWVPAADVDGWSLDAMRRATDEDLPSGIVDAMIIATAEHLRERDQKGLGLNFAVLRTVVSGEREGRVPDLARQVLTRLGSHSQMESLWRFNAKYDPAWRARYVVVDDLAQLATDGLAMARAEGLTGELPLVSGLPRLGEQLSGMGTALRDRLPGRTRAASDGDDGDDADDDAPLPDRDHGR